VSKHRVTLTLDEELIEALRKRSARSLSAAVNALLRQAVESDNHREAALQWLSELDARYGKASPEEQASNAAFLDDVGFGKSADHTAGAA
jgi:post-segregation antitoxin (ccd killing protein)